MEMEMEEDPGAPAVVLSLGEEGMGLVFVVGAETVRTAASEGTAGEPEGDGDM